MGTRISRAVALGLLMLTAACEALSPATMEPRARNQVFRAEEYAPYDSPGTGRIEGQAFMRQRGGTVVTAAGSAVSLNPATSYSREWFDAQLRGVPLQAADPRALKYNRMTQADGDGRFEFEGLAAGSYYVVTHVVWEAPVGYQGAMVTQGGTVGALVRVSEGEASRVVVTR